MTQRAGTFGLKTAPFTFDAAMRRLAYVMAIGCLIVVIFGISIGSTPFVTASVGLMISLACALGAGLGGFIFGVPYARDGSGPVTKNEATESAVPSTPAPAYRPNTSLEQISDWLTKIIVGVGLVEIKELPGAVQKLVAYLAPGINAGPAGKTFIVSTLIFFSVSGFLFGFLWARLYLRRWLVDADQDLIEKATRFDQDARAYSLVARQLERREDEDAVSSAELFEAIRAASAGAKAQIFEQAKAASENTDASDYDVIKNPAAVSIFEALIADDVQGRSHRNHSELAYTLDRRRPPKLHKALEALSEAIERRDKQGASGWRYYEFRRVRIRIKLDSSFRSGKQSEPNLVDSVLIDLKCAKAGDPARYDRWLHDSPEVGQWIQINGVVV